MKRLTFTFDNGPVPRATEGVLDFLAGRGIKATFFVIGKHLADPERRELAERARSEGHWIGNHTFSHGVPLGLEGDRARVECEIGDAQLALGDLAHPRKFFRPNGGGELGPHVLSAEAIAYLKRRAYTLVTWNSVPGDWLSPHEAWFDRAIGDLDRHDWTLIVLHDEHIRTMLDLLARFCDELARRDIEIVQDFPDACVPIERGIAGSALFAGEKRNEAAF